MGERLRGQRREAGRSGSSFRVTIDLHTLHTLLNDLAEQEVCVMMKSWWPVTPGNQADYTGKLALSLVPGCRAPGRRGAPGLCSHRFPGLCLCQARCGRSYHPGPLASQIVNLLYQWPQLMRKAWPTPCTVKGIRNSERFSSLLKAAQLSSGRIRMEIWWFSMQSRCCRPSAPDSELLRGRNRCSLVLRNEPSGLS